MCSRKLQQSDVPSFITKSVLSAVTADELIRKAELET